MLIRLRDVPMSMKLPITLALVGAGFAPLQPALADTLRCGDALIEPGDDAEYVLEVCGQPDASATPGRPLPTEGLDISTYPLYRADRWLYHRGPGMFPAVVIIGDDGRVEAIELVKHRD
jgi:hypothetical protein